jgi:hypothetical protein
MMAPGRYEVRIAAEIRRTESDGGNIKLSLPPLELHIEEP